MSELKEVNDRLDKLTNFISKHMVTKQELSELKAELPTKADFSQLQSSVDGIARDYKTLTQELPVMGHRVSRIESWVTKAAEKIGLPYRP